MATKKLTLNELRSLVKQIINVKTNIWKPKNYQARTKPPMA